LKKFSWAILIFTLSILALLILNQSLFTQNQNVYARCPNGTHKSPSGDCEKYVPHKGLPRCPNGSHRSPDGDCEKVSDSESDSGSSSKNNDNHKSKSSSKSEADTTYSESKEFTNNPSPTLPSPSLSEGIEISGPITYIVDGDTLDVNNIRIRLALVNTPEVGQNGFYSAKYFVENLCLGKNGQVDIDNGQRQGSFGREIGVVYCDKVNLNEALMSNNLAVIDTRFCEVSEFAAEIWANPHCQSNPEENNKLDSQPPNEDSVTSQDDSNQPSPYNIKLGISLKHPTDWKLVNLKNGIQLVKENNGVYVEIRKHDLESSNTELKQYVDDDINDRSSSRKDFKLTYEKPSTIGNLPAYEALYTFLKTQNQKDYSVGGPTNKVLRTWVYSQGNVYTVAYVSEDDKYELYLPTAQKIINSFKINPVSQQSFSDNDSNDKKKSSNQPNENSNHKGSNSNEDSNGGSGRCKDGYHKDESGECEKVVNNKGKPRCPNGYHRSPDGDCERARN